MEDVDWIFCIIWDQEERVEGVQGTGDSGWGTTVPEEIGESIDGEWMEDKDHCPHHRFETGVELMVIGIHITEGFLQNFGIEEINTCPSLMRSVL